MTYGPRLNEWLTIEAENAVHDQANVGLEYKMLALDGTPEGGNMAAAVLLRLDGRTYRLTGDGWGFTTFTDEETGEQASRGLFVRLDDAANDAIIDYAYKVAPREIADAFLALEGGRMEDGGIVV